MSRIDPNLVGDSDLGYDALTDNDAELRGFLFPWMHSSVQVAAHPAALKPPTGGGGGGGGGGAGGGVPGPAPAAGSLHAGPSFASVGAANGSYMIPPDSASAVSESAVILATNGEIQIYSRGATNTALTKFTDVSLDSFFGATGAFDPRVIYDPVSHKLIVVAVDQSSANHTSHIHLAISDATGGNFTYQTIDATSALSGAWADFPQVGLDNAGDIYLTGNMFSFSAGSFQGSRLWIAHENGSAATVVDPSSMAGVGELFSLAPANMVEPGAVSAGSGEYLVSYNSAKLASGHNVLDVLHVDSLGHASHTTVDLGAIDQLAQYGGLTAPQPGTTRILDADDSRVASAVYKDGYLYAAATILPKSGPDAGHTTAHWWVMSIDGAGTPHLVNQGDISGNTFEAGSNLRSYYPSLAVGANGELAVSFSGSAPQSGTGYTGNPSAYEVTIANPLDTAHTEIGAWSVLQAGQDNYYRTFGGTDNRWGDYSSISVDPLNPNSFWAYNEYAMAHGISFSGQNGLWGTELGLFG